MKEEIIVNSEYDKNVSLAEGQEDAYIHCCRYELIFDYDENNKSLLPNHSGSHFRATIFTTKIFRGKCRITIEEIE